MRKGTAHDRFRAQVRREYRTKMAAGWQNCEPNWEIARGSKWHLRYVILHATISLDGKSIFYKLGERKTAST